MQVLGCQTWRFQKREPDRGKNASKEVPPKSEDSSSLEDDGRLTRLSIQENTLTINSVVRSRCAQLRATRWTFLKGASRSSTMAVALSQIRRLRIVRTFGKREYIKIISFSQFEKEFKFRTHDSNTEGKFQTATTVLKFTFNSNFSLLVISLAKNRLDASGCELLTWQCLTF